jgi:hypothetical protein
VRAAVVTSESINAVIVRRKSPHSAVAWGPTRFLRKLVVFDSGVTVGGGSASASVAAAAAVFLGDAIVPQHAASQIHRSISSQRSAIGSQAPSPKPKPQAPSCVIRSRASSAPRRCGRDRGRRLSSSRRSGDTLRAPWPRRRCHRFDRFDRFDGFCSLPEGTAKAVPYERRTLGRTLFSPASTAPSSRSASRSPDCGRRSCAGAV